METWDAFSGDMNVFATYCGQLRFMTTDWRPSGPPILILERPMALITSHESSGAHVGLPTDHVLETNHGHNESTLTRNDMRALQLIEDEIWSYRYPELGLIALGLIGTPE